MSNANDDQLDLFSENAASSPVDRPKNEPLEKPAHTCSAEVNRDRPAAQPSVEAPTETKATTRNAGAGRQISPPEKRFLSDKDLARRYSVSRPTIWRWAKNLDGFPVPVQITPGTSRWSLEELQAYDRALLQRSSPVRGAAS